MNENRVRKGFNALAPIYDRAVNLFFGKKIVEAQTYYFSMIKSKECLLILGGGTGWILDVAIEQNLATQYYYVDLSDAMIESAKSRIRNKHPDSLKRVKFICGSINDVSSEVRFDVVITPFVMDCFADAEAFSTMQQIKLRSLPSVEWLYSDFRIPNDSVLQKWWGTLLIKSLYTFFNIVCGLGTNKLPSVNKHFKELGFQLISSRNFAGGKVVSSVYVTNEAATTNKN